MQKLSFSGIFMLFSIHILFAQSGTVLPTQADFSNNTNTANAYAVKGIITSTTPGIFSVGVRGQNNGTGGNGIGVWGSHAGNGWGIYGTSNSGHGIYGSSATGIAGKFDATNPNSFSQVLDVTNYGLGSGIVVNLQRNNSGARGIEVTHAGVGPGVFATSAGGNAVWGITSSISAAGVIGDNTFGEAVVGRNRGGSGVGAVVGRNDSTGYGVRGFNTKGGIGVLGQAGISGGTGVGGRFENINAANSSNALETTTNGTGAGAYLRNQNSGGNGAGAIVQKNNPYSGAFTTNPNADLEVRHPLEYTPGMTGLRILNTGPNLNSWTLYTTNADGNLGLYAKGSYRGYFNPSTGAYTTISDSRLKNNIQAYGSTLDKLMKIGVKSYQAVNSSKTEVGLLAQEALQYFPEIVYSYTHDDGQQNYAMDYSRIGVLAVKAVQEQQVIIEKQQARIDALASELAALKQLVEANLKK